MGKVKAEEFKKKLFDDDKDDEKVHYDKVEIVLLHFHVKY